MKILMKHLAVGFMTAGTAVVGARQTAAPPAAAEASTNVIGPKIQFATPLHDFGRARAGEPVKYTYVFTNTGDRLLILNTVQPQCGCTTAGDWTRQVQPGNTGSIPIQFNTANYNGPVFKQVTVTCNVTNQPTLFLQLKGTVYKPFDLNPSMAVLNIPPDAETASVVVTITNNTEEPLVLSTPESNNRAFAAELKTNALGKGYQLIVSAVPPTPPGSVQGQISLRTSWTNPAVITVPVAANVQPAVMVIPSYITLAPGPLANAVTNSVSIRNNSTNDLKLSDPVVNVPGVEAEIKEMQPGKSFTALLAFPQGFQIPPGQQVELSVKSSNPKFPVVKIPVMQTPRPAPPAPHPAAPMKPMPTPIAPAKPVPTSIAKPPPLPPLPAGH
jgi:copper(I)-binding protein